MNLAHWIVRWADFQPGRCAVHFDGRDWTYADVADGVARLAGALAQDLGIRAGDRVAHLGYNSVDLLLLVFACARLGATLVPLNWRLAPPEHAFILDHADASALLAEPEFIAPTDAVRDRLSGIRLVAYGAAPGWESYGDLVREARPLAEGAGDLGSPMLIVYTSGTTGRPKGAVLSQNALLWNAVNSTQAHDLTSRDHVLTVLPMFHVGGMNIQTLPALHAGATVTLLRRFDPGAALKMLVERRPTLTLVVPAVMQALIRHPDWARADLSSLRLIMAGSSNIPEALIRPFHDRGIPVGQVYGSTETCPIAIYLRGEEAMRKLGSAGKPAVHCEVRLVDDENRDVPPGWTGEILVRGPNVMDSYWRDPAATAAALHDGWFHTGDVGHCDADGFYYVDDRKKDLIISGGENIYPAELENVLADCPQIAEAAVVARPDPRWGEVPVAVVVPKTAGLLTADAVLALFEGRLARYKHPHAVLFVEALPRNAMGKVLKYELRDRLRRDAATVVGRAS